jgi:transcriptional regulator with XRE-family HTH domain
MRGKRTVSPATAFGLALRRLRLSAGLSQEQLAFDAGVQRNFISLIERGENQPTITTIWKLAVALGLSASALVQECEKEAVQVSGE